MTDVVHISIPRENINDEVVTLVRWHLSDGDEVSTDQVIADVEGSKSTFEIIAPSDGFVRLAATEGEEVAVGSTLCRLFMSEEEAGAWADDEPEDKAGGEPGNETSAAPEEASRISGFVRFSEPARSLIEERGLDPGLFEGRGLVRVVDVLEFFGERQPENEAPARPAGAVAAALPAARPPGRLQALNPAKRAEVRYLGTSVSSTLPSSVTVCVPTRSLQDAMQHNGTLEGNTTALIVYEAARLLRKYPVFNACYQEGHAYIYDSVNVGVAMDSGSGLRVPVIRDADAKSMADIVTELRELLVRYVSGELSVREQADCTFTVTDLSASNVFSFQPIINRDQSAILGVGAEYFPPGGREGVFNLTLQFDHQVAEGRLAASFLNDLAQRLQGYEAAMSGVGTQGAEGPQCARCCQSHQELRALRHFLVQCVGSDGKPLLVCTACLQSW